MMKKRALLIGCCYIGTPKQLNGGGNNVKNMEMLLTTELGYSAENIVSLCDDYPKDVIKGITYLEPTRENIIAQLLYIVSQSATCSEICIFYSGHGSRVKDNTIFQDGNSGYDSCLTPIDADKYGVITNNELYVLLILSACPTWVLCDCCYSGSLFDLPYQFQVKNNEITQTYYNHRIEFNPHIVMISACSYVEYGYEFYDNDAKQFAGILTDAFIHAMKENNYEAPIQKILIKITEIYATLGLPTLPTPILSSSTSNPTWKFSKTAQILTPPVCCECCNMQ